MKQMRIDELVAMAEKQMVSYGYADTGMRAYARVWERFQSYANTYNLVYYTEELMLAFMEEEYRAFSAPHGTRAQREKLCALNKLDECHKYQLISSKHYSKQKKYEFAGKISHSVRRYLAFRGPTVSKARLQSIMLYLERFCKYVDTCAIQGEGDLTAGIIQGFIESCSIYTKSTVASTACCLRGYLSFLHANCLSQSDLTVFVPRITTRKDSEIPSSYSAEDVEKLLDSINRCNAMGKRDYAMLLLAARLGLRSSDICSLKFSSLDWERNEIALIQQKTGEPACYPLLKEVGVAIIDYLKNGRKSLMDEPFLFLREAPPYTRLANGSLYNIVDRHMKLAGIHVPAGKKHGPHALRHSLSSRLLENDVPLPIISEILGHRSTETTKAYLKIAEGKLSECPLAVPPVVKGA